MFSLKQLATILATIALTVSGANAARAESDGPGGTGGGSSIAAEVERATETFIKIVEKNESLFGVRAEQLHADVDIVISGSPIKLEKNGSSLQGCSSEINGQKTTLIDGPSWVTLKWKEKVFLAGHERLVVLGLEPSNKYPISNKLFELEVRKNRSAKFNSLEEICAKTNCQYVESYMKQLDHIGNSLLKGTVDADLGSFLLSMTISNIEATDGFYIGMKELSGTKFNDEANRSLRAYLQVNVLKVKAILESKYSPVFCK